MVQLSVITVHTVLGVIVEIGTGVKKIKAGDEVYYISEIFNYNGSYTEYHVAKGTIIGIKPKKGKPFESGNISFVKNK